MTNNMEARMYAHTHIMLARVQYSGQRTGKEGSVLKAGYGSLNYGSERSAVIAVLAQCPSQVTLLPGHVSPSTLPAGLGGTRAPRAPRPRPAQHAQHAPGRPTGRGTCGAGPRDARQRARRRAVHAAQAAPARPAPPRPRAHQSPPPAPPPPAPGPRRGWPPAWLALRGRPGPGASPEARRPAPGRPCRACRASRLGCAHTHTHTRTGARRRARVRRRAARSGGDWPWRAGRGMIRVGEERGRRAGRRGA